MPTVLMVPVVSVILQRMEASLANTQNVLPPAPAMLQESVEESAELMALVHMTSAAQILTAMPAVEESVQLMALVHMTSAVQILTVTILMECAMYLHHMMKSTVTTAMEEIVILVCGYRSFIILHSFF